MKLRILAAAAALAFACSAPAFASDGQVTVALQAPLAAKTKIIAGGAVFSCEANACVAWGAPERAVTAATCKAIAKQTGAVASVEGYGHKLTDDQLARCNSGVAAPATVTAQN
jgi:hypothetical protein